MPGTHAVEMVPVTELEQVKKVNTLLVEALRDYHALMGNVHMLRESKESQRRWMDARHKAQKQAQAALAAVGAERE